MDLSLEREPRVLWSFWLACGLAATGGIAPLLLAAGGPDRIAGVVIPYGIAAGAMAANALMYQRGRPLATALYFLAGVAIVYGMLLMFAVPLRLAVVGTCPEPPAVCPAGFERAFSSGEGTGFTIAVLMGALAILSGFFGLLILFRRRPKPNPPPPARTMAPVNTSTTPPASVESPTPTGPPLEVAAETSPEPATLQESAEPPSTTKPG